MINLNTFSQLLSQTVQGAEVSRWGWTIPTYFFLGGVVAASLILAQLPGLLKLQLKTSYVRWLLLGQLAALLIGSALLVLDLGQPDRFLNIFFSFNFKSFLAIGSRLLIFLIGLTIVQLLYVFRNQAIPSVFKWTSIVFEVALIFYPAFLLFRDRRDAWHNPMLLVDFPVTALLGGGAVLLAVLGSTLFLQSHAYRSWLIGLIIAEAILLGARLIWVSSISDEGSIAINATTSGPYALPFWLIEIGLGLVLPLAALLGVAQIYLRRQSRGEVIKDKLEPVSRLDILLRFTALLILVGLLTSKFIVVNAI